MSSNTDVETRFLELKNSYSEEQWRDVELLSLKVKALEASDLTLAYRLMQRVKNLKPSPQSLSILERLKIKLDQQENNVPVSETSTPKAKNNFSTYSGKLVNVKIHPKVKRFATPFFLFVGLPFILFAFYQILWASDRYESRTKLILKEPDAASTLDPALAMLSGLGGAPSTNDTELLKAYIESMDMVEYLQSTLDLRTHFSVNDIDVFSRLSKDASNEELLKYFISRIVIEIDDVSGILELRVQGFTSDFTQSLAKNIVARAEWYINEIGNTLAQAQLTFVKKEHEEVERRLHMAKTNILDFQREFNLLDPEAEGAALQQITYRLEGEIASKKAQLRTLLSGMSDVAPAVVQLKEELKSIQKQIAIERQRLTNVNSTNTDKQGVGEILAQYSNYKIDLEFALQAYSASQVSLEKSRIEAYRQLKYLVLVESPILPQDAKYPEVKYNLTLALVLLLMLFGIGRILLATVAELR